MKKISVGIDCGFCGAVVVLDESQNVLCWCDTPINDGASGPKFDAQSMARSMIFPCGCKIYYAQVAVWIEKAQAMPKQGVVSTFKIGHGFGLWEGICAGMGLEYHIISPRVWQKEMLAGVCGKNTKVRSMSKCSELFPEIPLIKPRGRKPSLHGRSDAALIAAWGLKQQ